MTTAQRRDGRYPALDGMRALASLAVVFTHVGYATGRSLDNDLIGPLLGRGNFGVTVFFLLSGFLLYRPFALYSFGGGRKPGLGTYFWRRAFRIFPALWLTVTVTLLFLSRFPVNWSNWASYFLLIQTYNHHDYDPSLGQLWTLVVEVSFYALLPILARIVGGPQRGPDAVLRRQAALLAVMVVVTQLFNLAFYHGVITNLQSVLWLPNYLDWFAGGMALAVLTCVPEGTRALRGLRRSVQVWADSGVTCALVAAVLMALCLLPLGMPRNLAPGLFWQWTAEHYLFLACAFFLLLPLVLGRPGRVAGVLGSRAAALGGSLSYSVYLWHPQLMQWLQRTLDIKPFSGHFPLLFALTLGSTLIVAAASWYLVEKPLLTYSTRVLRRRTKPDVAPMASAATQSS
jgi:peptidoglycan/LPS O-acetylase OafA/YrhL